MHSDEQTLGVQQEPCALCVREVMNESKKRLSSLLTRLRAALPHLASPSQWPRATVPLLLQLHAAGPAEDGGDLLSANVSSGPGRSRRRGNRRSDRWRGRRTAARCHVGPRGAGGDGRPTAGAHVEGVGWLGDWRRRRGWPPALACTKHHIAAHKRLRKNRARIPLLDTLSLRPGVVPVWGICGGGGGLRLHSGEKSPLHV